MLSHIRTTMSDERLNDLMVLNVVKEEVNKSIKDNVDVFAELKIRGYPLF